MIKYNQNLLYLCEADTDTILDLNFFPSAKVERTDRYTYFDNNSNILAVAHADTVMDMRGHIKATEVKIDAGVLVGLSRKQRRKLKKELRKKAEAEGTAVATPTLSPAVIYGDIAKDAIINTIALDDRLGIWMITDVLPSMGIICDVLITTDEESASSSAHDFTTTKDYNWIFQFDRHGIGNVVMYDYDNSESESLLEGLGYELEIGTYSDICALEFLGCIGFNFGCGYKNEHTKYCISRESWVTTCVLMFESFYNEYKDLPMPYTPKPHNTVSRWGAYASGGSYGRNGTYYSGYWEDGYTAEGEIAGGYSPSEIAKSNASFWTKEQNKNKPNLCGYCDNPLLTEEEKEIEICVACVIESGLCGLCGTPDTAENPVFSDDQYGMICSACDAKKWDAQMGRLIKHL